MTEEANLFPIAPADCICAVKVELHQGGVGWANFRNRRPYIGSDTTTQEQPFMMTEEDAEAIIAYVAKFGSGKIYRLTPI